MKLFRFELHKAERFVREFSTEWIGSFIKRCLNAQSFTRRRMSKAG